MILAGRNPDTVNPDDWCDVAWALLMRQMPVMGDPVEYRDTLWLVLHDGELTAEMKKRNAKGASKRARKSVGKPVPKSARDQLAEMRRRAEELQRERDVPQGESVEG